MNCFKRSQTRLFVLLSAVLLLGGCASVPMPKGDSDGYTTYRFYQPNVVNAPDFTDRDRAVNAMIRSEMVERFQQNGLTPAGDDADLVVAYLLIVQDSVVSTAISDYYISSGSEILKKAHKKVAIDGAYRDSYKAGTIVVDIVDAQSGELIYRDYSSAVVTPALAFAERDQRIKTAVDEALEGFFR